MRHILKLVQGYCELTFCDDLFYFNESLSPKTHVMYSTLNACLSWLTTGAGSARYFVRYLDEYVQDDTITIVLTGNEVILIRHYLNSNSLLAVNNLSPFDFCKDILETFRKNPESWSEFTKDPDRTTKEIEKLLTKLANELTEIIEEYLV